MEKRLALWGSLIVFIVGIIFAINASLDSQFVGAGLILIACAFACGIVGYIFLKQ
jgi:hypothetical protein